ncbi:hypothetical protein [Sphingomonas hominis]|nr:hypothetical protein [Sphingomonas hominis]
MSEALSKVGKVAGVVATVAAFIPGGQTIALVASAVALAANIGAEITAVKPPARGSVNAIAIGSDNPTPYLIGRTYYGGTRVYQRGYGPTIDQLPNPYLLLVDIYSGAGPVDGLEGMYADFQPISFAGDQASGYFSGFMWRDTQVGVAPELSALTPHWSGAPNWGAAAKLSGKAAIAWSLKRDKKGKVFASGVPQTGAVWRGVRCWDPRLDSSWPGGSGPCRLADPVTWPWTRNPGLHGLKYALGTYHAGQKVFGIGMPIDGLIVSDFLHLANVSDANGWHCDGVIFEPGNKWTNLKDILAAGASEPVFVGGRLGVMVAAPRVALDTVTADDLADDEIVVGAGRGWEARLNTIVPKYRSEAHQWEYVQTENAVARADLIAIDGEEKKEERQYNLVQDATQATQLAALELLDRRELGDIEITVKPRLRRYGAGTLVIVDLPEAGLASTPCVILKRTLDPQTMTVKWVLRGETPAKYAYALEQTGTPPATPALRTTADYDDVATGAAAINRAAHWIRAQTVEFPATTTATSIEVVAFGATLDDGRVINLPAGQIDGLDDASNFRLFYALEDATPAYTGATGEAFTGADGQAFAGIIPAGSYYAAPSDSLLDAANPAFVAIRLVTTANADGTTYPPSETPPAGDSGSGYGGGGRYQQQVAQ